MVLVFAEDGLFLILRVMPFVVVQYIALQNLCVYS